MKDTRIFLGYFKDNYPKGIQGYKDTPLYKGVYPISLSQWDD